LALKKLSINQAAPKQPLRGKGKTRVRDAKVKRLGVVKADNL
jgi:hypothetical protein